MKDICELCGDTIEACLDAEECPASIYPTEEDPNCFFCNKVDCLCDEVINP